MKKQDYAYVVTFIGLMGSLFCLLYLLLNG